MISKFELLIGNSLTLGANPVANTPTEETNKTRIGRRGAVQCNGVMKFGEPAYNTVRYNHTITPSELPTSYFQ